MGGEFTCNIGQRGPLVGSWLPYSGWRGDALDPRCDQGKLCGIQSVKVGASRCIEVRARLGDLRDPY